MFSFLFLNTVSKLKKRKVLKPTPHLCITYNKASAMSLVALFILTLVYMLSVNNGVAVIFAKSVPALLETNESFLISTGNAISLFTPTTSSKSIIFSDLTKAQFLEIANIRENKTQIFWGDTKENAIYSSLIQNKSLENNSKVVVVKGVVRLFAIFVDSLRKNVYFLNGQGHIEVCKFDSTMRTSVVNKIRMINSSCLVGDAFAGLLFWSSLDVNGWPILERSNLDGSGRLTIYTSESELDTLDKLCVAESLRKIFWIHKSSSQLHKMNYDGSAHELVGTNKKLSSVISISVVSNSLFWVEDDISSGALVQVNLNNLEERKIMTLSSPFMYDAKPYSTKVSERILKDSCEENNGGCSHLCLHGTDEAYSCVCPYGLQLLIDNQTCINRGPVLAVGSDVNNLRTLTFVDWTDPEKWVFPPVNVMRDDALGFTIDPMKNEMYWIENRKIYKQSLLSGNSALVLNLSNFEPKSLAFDWESGNLYIVSRLVSNGSVISVCKRNGSSFSHLMWDYTYEIQQISLDLENKKLFWSHWATNIGERNNSVVIEMCSLNGENRRRIYESNHDLDFLTPDSRGRQLCWLLASRNIINCRSYGGGPLQTFSIRSSSQIKAMCYFNGHLVVADEIGNIQMVNVSSTQPNSRVFNFSPSINFLTVVLGSYSMKKNRNVPIEPSIRENAMPFLLYTSNLEPRTISLSDPTMPELLPYSIFDNLSLPLNITNQTLDQVEFSNNAFYWVMAGRKIISVQRDGTDKKLLVESDSVIGGIAVDSVTGNIYWTLPYELKIMVVDNAGRYPTVLTSFSHSQFNGCYPLALTHNSYYGDLYFVMCCHNICNIRFTTSDGSSPLIIGTPRLIGDLVVQGSHLYFTEPDFGSIKSVNLRTKVVETLIESSSDVTLRPLSLAISHDGRKLYWTDSLINNGSVLEMTVYSKSYEVLKSATGVSKLLMASDYMKESNPCAKNNGGCSHLCIYRSNSHEKCHCSFSYLVNETKCKPYESYLLVTDQDKIRSLDYENPSKLNPPLPTIKPGSDLKNIVAITYNFHEERIIFSDLYQSPHLFSIFPNGTGFRTELEDSRRRFVEGLVYDSITATLFWTDSNKPSIWSLSRNNSEQLLFSLAKKEKPRGIAVHSCSQQLFWTNIDKIETGDFFGQNRKTLISDNLGVASGLAVFGNELFWTTKREDDTLEFVIEKSDLDGNNRMMIVSGKHRRPFAIVPTATNIFWTDREQKVLCLSPHHALSTESCQVVMPGINPLGFVIVSNRQILCDGNRTKLEPLDYNLVHKDITNFNNSSNLDGEEEVDSHANATFNKLIISGSVISTAAILVFFLFVIRRKRYRKRATKCATSAKSPIRRKPLKEKELNNKVVRLAKSNPSFELDDVFCSDILEEDILLSS